MILSISRLLLDTIYREELYLKTLLQQLHFLFKPSKPGLSILLINIGCYFWAKGKSMTNEVRTKCRMCMA